MTNQPITPLNRSTSSCGLILPTGKDRDVLLAMIDKAYRADSQVSMSIETISFKYATILLATVVVLLSDRIVIEGLYPKLAATFAIILFVAIATIDLWLKRKQHSDLGKVLVHLEDLAGCYTPDCFVEGARLLPPKWLDTDNFVGRKVTRIRFLIFWGIGAVGCSLVWLAN